MARQRRCAARRSAPPCESCGAEGVKSYPTQHPGKIRRDKPTHVTAPDCVDTLPTVSTTPSLPKALGFDPPRCRTPKLIQQDGLTGWVYPNTEKITDQAPGECIGTGRYRRDATWKRTRSVIPPMLSIPKQALSPDGDLIATIMPPDANRSLLKIAPPPPRRPTEALHKGLWLTGLVTQVAECPTHTNIPHGVPP